MRKSWFRRGVSLLAAVPAGSAAEEAARPKVEWVWDAEPFPEDAELLTLWVAPLTGADCMYLTYAGHSMLIDVGDRTTTAQVDAFLEEAGAERADYLFSTHPHADHVGGLFHQLERGFPIGAFITVFEHDYYEDMQVVIQRQAIEAAEAAGIPILDMGDGDTIPFGDAELTIIRMPDERIEKSMNCNNLSAMLMVRLGDCSLLLTADTEGRAQSILTGLYDFRADILKFPHHGLRKADRGFIRAVDPVFTFINHGASDSAEAQAQMKKEGYDWLAFASWGTLILRTDGTRWTVEQRFSDRILRHAVKTYRLDEDRVKAWPAGGE